jgi:hypothetical protein
VKCDCKIGFVAGFLGHFQFLITIYSIALQLFRTLYSSLRLALSLLGLLSLTSPLVPATTADGPLPLGCRTVPVPQLQQVRLSAPSWNSIMLTNCTHSSLHPFCLPRTSVVTPILLSFATDGQRVFVSAPIWGLMKGWVSNCFWALPEQSPSCPSPAELTTLLHCLI